MIREIHAPHLGRTVKMGRLRPPPSSRKKLKLCSYLTCAEPLPPPPDSADYTQAGLPVLGNMYLNDRHGDCVIAGGYHVIGVASGNAGSLFEASDAQIIADYSAIGGYDPTNPASDEGCDEQTALNYWSSEGFADGSKLSGWATVDATNELECKQALFLFEHLYFGMELPEEWVAPMPSGPGFVWGVAGDSVPRNGHCVMGAAFDSSGVTIDTWGLLGTLTWEAIAKYAIPSNGGELYVMLSPDQLAKGATKAPNGVQWDSLVADLAEIAADNP